MRQHHASKNHFYSELIDKKLYDSRARRITARNRTICRLMN